MSNSWKAIMVNELWSIPSFAQVSDIDVCAVCVYSLFPLIVLYW